VNGISELATRSDLLDRSIVLNLPTINESGRRPESELWEAFAAVHPRILGAVLDAVSRALGNLAAVRRDNLPRMADFARWAIAAESAQDQLESTFLNTYAGNRTAAHEVALEAAPIVASLRKLVEKTPKWTGTASALLTELNDLLDDQDTQRSRAWPKDATRLSNQLRRLAPNLRATGIDVQFTTPHGVRLVTVKGTSEAVGKNGTEGKAGEDSVPSVPSVPPGVDGQESGTLDPLSGTLPEPNGTLTERSNGSGNARNADSGTPSGMHC
jgi:hypothetical protein